MAVPTVSTRMSVRRGASSADAQKTFILALYVLHLALSIYLTNFSIGGLPIRSLFSVALLGYLVLTEPQAFARALKLSRFALVITLAMFVIGSAVSLYNKMPPGELAAQLVQIHIQAAVTILITATVAVRCGVKLALGVFIWIVGLSCVFAVGQFLGIDAAWTLRRVLGALQSESTRDVGLGSAQRAMGLSLSKTILATQSCLAFSAFVLMRLETRNAQALFGMDPMVLAALGLFVVVGIAGGNRSPLLGAVVFFVLYAFYKNPSQSWIFFPLAALVLLPTVPVVLDLLQGMGLRVATLEDKSTDSRGALLKYGLELLKDNPIGYGLDFNPTNLWQEYWSDIANTPGANNIVAYPLHNYFLSMLNVYGISLFFLVPLVIVKMLRGVDISILFVPYLIHILFHNAGPFWSDAYIWFVVGCVPVLFQKCRVARPGSFQ